MERVRRRWWTTTVSVFAVLVILAATASGLFQAAVLALPSYRDDLSDWVTKVAGRPVDIGGVSLVWHGIYPRLDLSDITLYSDDGEEEEVLSAQRLSLGFGLLRLATGDFTPTQIELSGLSLSVQVDEHGKLSIVGLDNVGQTTPPDLQKLLHELTRFRSVRLQNCQIELSAPQLPEGKLNLTLASAELAQTLSGFGAGAELSLPAAYGKRVSFEADIDGAVDQIGAWSGEFRLDSRGLQPQPWLQKILLPGTRAALDDARVELRGRVQGGRLSTLEARASADALLLGRAGQNIVLKSPDLLAQATPGVDGWQLEIKRLRLDDQDQLRGSLHYAPQPEGAGYDLNADVDLLRLDRLAPWLGYLREPPQALALAARSSGEVEGLVLRLRKPAEGAAQYSLHASLKNLALRAGYGAVGFSDLSGELVADEHSGRFALMPGALRLELPHALNSAVNFDQLSGEARWNRRNDGWQLQLPGFAWKLASIAGQGHMNLLLPSAEGASPELDLSATFSAGDATQAKPFMPKVWGADLHKWLDRAIVGGRVPRGQLEIHGPLADFPFHQRKTGEWKLDLDVVNANLAYLPDWPAVDQIKAHLAFSGNSLDIAADSGNLLGNHIDKAHARFADFHDAVLQVDANVSGETTRFYDFLNGSPLKQTLSGLVDHTRASGPATVGVHLDIPLREAVHTQISGNVALDGVELRYQGLSQPLRNIRGNIAFSNAGVQADKLNTQFADLDVNARILPRAGTHGVVAADFNYAIKPDGSGASGFVPEFVRKLVGGGSAHWLAELPLGGGDGLTFSTDMQGVAVPLPAPLGKRADETAPLSVTVAGVGGDNAMRVRVNYRERLGADIALVGAGDKWTARGVSLFVGRDGSPAPAGEGLTVNGNVDELDLAAWAGALHESARDGGLPLRRAELRAAQVNFMGHIVHDVHAVLTPDAGGWITQLDGPGAEGALNWRDAGAGKVEARLKRLAVEFHNSGLPASAPEKPANAFDPNQFPLLDIACDQLSVSGLDLGKLALVTQRVPGGQRVEKLALAGGKTSLDADGWWKRENALSSASLKFKLQSEDSAATLKAFGYSPTLDARQNAFTGELNWAAQPAGIAWEQARGRVGIDVKSGSLRSVEPGAGRVLGLINIFALPRRLTLDFRDVVSSGLGFDSITGNYELADGSAVTSDLDIAGPSLHMEVRGRIGLVARDFDQKVTVHPDVSSGVTIGAALIGGPAAGVLVLLAQQVLKQPLDKVTQFSYRVTGPWDNPKVE